MEKIHIFIHKLKTAFVFLPTFLFPFVLMAQVVNDNVEQALRLFLGTKIKSQTDSCTVQANCVDESLTGKCIDYHNDQWFIFNSEDRTRIFLNVTNQNCRDMKGVQIVVLKGNPCDLPTYKILQCVSLASHDDVYIELDSLTEDTDYFTNVDGYLNDYCRFELELSLDPKGFPLVKTSNFITKSHRTAHKIRMDWEITDSLIFIINEFEIYKKEDKDFKYNLSEQVPLNTNSYGTTHKHYFFEDSIEPGKHYSYLLAVRATDGRLYWIDTYRFYYPKNEIASQFVGKIEIPLQNPRNKDIVTVIIFDYASNEILKSNVFTYERKDPKYLTYHTKPAVQRGFYTLLVKVINNTSGVKYESIYDLNLNQRID